MKEESRSYVLKDVSKTFILSSFLKMFIYNIVIVGFYTV